MAIDLAAIAAKVRDHVEDALAEGAQVILDRSQELVPRDARGRADTHGGTLAESGRVNKNLGSGGLPIVSVTYDGPYAAYQHEAMEFRHPTGGSAKFLELAVVEKADDAVNKIGDEIRKVLET
jgi:hypothetical protein